MEKFKQSAYTLILIATCFVASPFIFHKIWTTSSDAKKEPEKPSVSDESQPAEDSTPDTSEVQPDESTPDENVPDETNVSFVTSDISYFDDALFIGDSRTVGIMEYGTFSKSDYFCSVGMSAGAIDEVEINGTNFDQMIDYKQYGKVYIMLGVNEVGNDAEVTLTSYRAIVEKIKVHQPNALIYIQGNLHVSADAETDTINNSALNHLNDRLASLADNKRVFYIDINEVYDDEYGCFTASYTSDGIHPLAMYYRKWCEWLCTKTIVSDTVPEEVPTTEYDFYPPETSVDDVQSSEPVYEYVPPESDDTQYIEPSYEYDFFLSDD